jgi:hypothetical protein
MVGSMPLLTGPPCSVTHEHQARELYGSFIWGKRRAFRVRHCIVCESRRIWNPRNLSAGVAVVCGPGRLQVPAPAAQHEFAEVPRRKWPESATPSRCTVPELRSSSRDATIGDAGGL